MNEMNIITQMGNPEILAQMSTMDKFLGSLMVTALGMGITFVSLIVIRYATVALSSAVKSIETKKKPTITEVKAPLKPIQKSEVEEDDDELIAIDDERDEDQPDFVSMVLSESAESDRRDQTDEATEFLEPEPDEPDDDEPMVALAEEESPEFDSDEGLLDLDDTADWDTDDEIIKQLALKDKRIQKIIAD